MINTQRFIKEFMFGMKWKYNKKGFTIVELMVAIGVIVIVFLTILGFFIFDARVADRSRMRLKSISLAEEAFEAVRNFRNNNSWNVFGIGTLAPGVDYYPASSSSGWDIILGDENIDGFVRIIIFDRVSRDINDNIENTYNPINDDSETRRVRVVVSWTDRYGPTNESLTTYITNWKE